MCLKGLRATGLADFPHSVEGKEDPDRESSLTKVPEQISDSAELDPRSADSCPGPGPDGCVGRVKGRGEPAPLPHPLPTPAHPAWHTWWTFSPVWAARPGAGRSEELPGFAEVAGRDLASVAGLGRQGECMG